MNNQAKEFYCLTCQSNNDIEGVINQVETTNAWWIPLNIRRTNGVGFIFTQESVFYFYHIHHGQHHDWGNVAEIEQKIADQKHALELLRNQQ